jgi:hypothetical protein
LTINLAGKNRKASLLQGKPQYRCFKRGKPPNQFWLRSVVMMSKNDSKTRDAYPIDGWVLRLEFRRAI